MKKLLVATLLVAGVSVALFSCNNGAYDAHPDKDLSSGKNPLDPNSGVNVYLGTMEGHINRKKVSLFNAMHQTDTYNIRHIVGTVFNDPQLQRRLEILVSNDAYQGPKMYAIGGEAFAWTFIFAVRDTTRLDRKIEHLYIANTSTGKGNIDFNVVGDEGGNMRGTFKGTVFRSILNEDGVTPSGQFDMTDSVVFGGVEFYVPPGKIW